jgi:SAM-dependent methyltransferase
MKRFCLALMAVCASQLMAQATDEALFFQPFVEKELANMAGKRVLDMGCALSEWTPFAASKGAEVVGVEEEEESLKSVAKLLASTGVEKAVTLTAAKMHALPFEREHFDFALSACVSAGLPSSLPFNKEQEAANLVAHFKEVARVLKGGGRVVIAAPASYDVVFTDGESDAIVQKEIDEALDKMPENPSEAQIVQALSSLNHVNRATFVFQGEKLALLKDQRELKLGQRVWRKEPQGVFPSFYHSEEEFLIAFKEAGLFCEELARPSFFGKVKYRMYHQARSEDQAPLGEAYVNKNPFTLYSLVKPA